MYLIESNKEPWQVTNDEDADNYKTNLGQHQVTFSPITNRNIVNVLNNFSPFSLPLLLPSSGYVESFWECGGILLEDVVVDDNENDNWSDDCCEEGMENLVDHEEFQIFYILFKHRPFNSMKIIENMFYFWFIYTHLLGVFPRFLECSKLLQRTMMERCKMTSDKVNLFVHFLPSRGEQSRLP